MHTGHPLNTGDNKKLAIGQVHRTCTMLIIFMHSTAGNHKIMNFIKNGF